ncbi:Gfo/Idh/MocA family oxidoreductase [Micrococcales bacterium 31B]|nr:Gfo/Idh/MocA family oxidoreductase [Micrococcales bacterium 31B]
MTNPVKIILVGAGPMGRGWQRVIAMEPNATLVGVVDLNLELAEGALEWAKQIAREGNPEWGTDPAPELLAEYDSVVVGTSLADVAAQTGAHAVVNVTAPKAHHPVTLQAFELGLHVLGEKPATDTLGEAVHLIAAAEAAGLQFVVSQNRRYRQELWDLKTLANGDGGIGGIGGVSAEFAMRHDAPGFRQTMEHPLLMDMSIHHFDIARFVMDAEAEAVYCEEYRVAKDWYDHPASTTCIFTMRDGRRFTYVGSWESPGLDTNWNARWRVTGPRGSAVWDGDTGLESQLSTREFDPAATSLPLPHGIDCPGVELHGSLKAFVDGVLSGTPAATEIRDNVHSLAMVKAAIRSSETGVRVLVRDILNEALEEARGLASGRALEILQQDGLLGA